jgi:hypothetical protein
MLTQMLTPDKNTLQHNVFNNLLLGFKSLSLRQ